MIRGLLNRGKMSQEVRVAFIPATELHRSKIAHTQLTAIRAEHDGARCTRHQFSALPGARAVCHKVNRALSWQ